MADWADAAVAKIAEENGLNNSAPYRFEIAAAKEQFAAALRQERERCAVIAERFNIPTMVTSMSDPPMMLDAAGPAIALAIRNQKGG